MNSIAQRLAPVVNPYPMQDVGGLAAQSTLVNITRAEVEEAGGHVLVLSAGDVNTGIPESDMLNAEPDIKAMNMIGYDAMALGLISVNGKKRVKYNDKSYYMYTAPGYVEDPEILEALEPYMAQADELLSQPIGEALVELEGGKSTSRSQETNLGNLITDGMRAKVGAEIAFQNGGGIRAGIAPGTITYHDVLTVQPFGNTLVTLDMTGAQILDVLNYAATLQPGAGAFLHVSGLSWTLNRKAGQAENVMVGDTPLDLNATYSVVTNNFMAADGDGYAMLRDIPQYDTGFVDADAFREYVTKQGKVEPTVEGRLTIVE